MYIAVKVGMIAWSNIWVYRPTDSAESEWRCTHASAVQALSQWKHIGRPLPASGIACVAQSNSYSLPFVLAKAWLIWAYYWLLISFAGCSLVLENPTPDYDWTPARHSKAPTSMSSSSYLFQPLWYWEAKWLSPSCTRRAGPPYIAACCLTAQEGTQRTHSLLLKALI